MRKSLGVILTLGAISIGLWLFSFSYKKNDYRGIKQQPLAIIKLSDAFNTSAYKMMNNYYSVAEDFVLWDSTAVVKDAKQLRAAMDSIYMGSFETETTVYEIAHNALSNAKVELNKLIGDSSFQNKKMAFHILTQHVFDFIRILQYDQEKVYFQECPMAFGEGQAGNWLSKTKDVRNPYLGIYHPQYKDQMLHCGEPKDTVDFQGNTVMK